MVISYEPSTTKPHVSYTYLVGSHELLYLLTYHMHLFTLQVII
jgi:hypothetical protein